MVVDAPAAGMETGDDRAGAVAAIGISLAFLEWRPFFDLPRAPANWRLGAVPQGANAPRYGEPAISAQSAEAIGL